MRPSSSLLAITFSGVCAALAAEPPAPPAPAPGLGLKVGLFAAEPDIVTPVGVAVDARGRVFVAENHTHEVKAGYPGPKTDRVRVLEDTDGDGKADRVTTFAEGFRHSMNLAFGPDGALLLVHRNGVLRLEDADGDGVCDRRTALLTLETKTEYPHNGLSGIALADGWLYIGSGENFGEPCVARAADGGTLTWTPGGARVLRMRPDGSQLESVATGMWNAFTLVADGAGRIFAADNDPDSRPPCRLLHVVPGADFGFAFQYGRAGTHPFTCWNGELPGTLPMVAGTGEAPTGMLDLRLAKLGPALGDGFLVTEWGDSLVSRFRLKPKGASFEAERETVLTGDAGFRPACLAVAPDGSVYMTDWADREYSVHGKGRVWKLSAVEPDKTSRANAVLPVSDAERRRDRLAAAADPAAWPELRDALTDSDPFIRSAAITALARPAFQPVLLRETAHPDAGVRLGVLLALRRADVPDPEPLVEKFLTDADPAVRRAAMIWAGEKRLKTLRPLVEKAIEDPSTPSSDYGLWLAALDLISRDKPPTAATAAADSDDMIQRLLADKATSPAVQAAVIPMLKNLKAPPAIRALIGLAANGAPPVRVQAVRALGFVQQRAAVAPLLKIAQNEAEPAGLRLDAIAALAGRDDATARALLPLLSAADPAVALEAARALRPHVSLPEVALALKPLAESAAAAPAVKAQAALALDLPPAEPRPDSPDAWRAALKDAPGDPERGRRVFFSPAAQCATCHTAEGRGVAVGPDLSTIARSSSREKLIDSILEPGREVGPLYGVKVVTLKDGGVLSGVAAPNDGGGALTLLQPGGATVRAPRENIAKVEETGASLMPAGLERALTIQDFRDLLAWLETLK